MFKTEFPMNQAEMYMECLIPQEELAKWFLQLASAHACWVAHTTACLCFNGRGRKPSRLTKHTAYQNITMVAFVHLSRSLCSDSAIHSLESILKVLKSVTEVGG